MARTQQKKKTEKIELISAKNWKIFQSTEVKTQNQLHLKLWINMDEHIHLKIWMQITVKCCGSFDAQNGDL